MRIIDEDRDLVTDEIMIILTPEEIEALIFKLSNLLDHPEKTHIHFSEIDKKTMNIIREIIVAIYTGDNIDEFSEKYKKIILDEN